MLSPSCDSLSLVQSTPVGSFDVPPLAEATWLALTRLVNSSKRSLDLTAMYVDLLGIEAREHFNASQMTAFGADRGVKLFDALKAAAARGVRCRLLLGTLNDPLNSNEVKTLLTYPSVSARSWDPLPWYGGGIMHAKLWVSDGSAAYLGSANADWKSLAQVKELGVLVRGRRLTADISSLFDIYWEWAAPGFAVNETTTIDSPTLLTTLQVPTWDPAVPPTRRQPSPFASSPAAAHVGTAVEVCDSGNATAGEAFVSASPGGALVPPRTPDLDALLGTITGARRTLCLSVMDFLPGSAYSGGHGGVPVHWAALTDAILAVAFARNVRVKLLVSHWAHTARQQVAAMTRLSDGLAACAGARQACAGSLEVRQFFVPGWNETRESYALSSSAAVVEEEQADVVAAAAAVWPAFTRVNHAKFIVSDSRVNIGTSNWEWGYFAQTAGASLNTDDPSLVSAAQAVFDADWESAYAVPLLLPAVH